MEHVEGLRRHVDRPKDIANVVARALVGDLGGPSDEVARGLGRESRQPLLTITDRLAILSFAKTESVFTARQVARASRRGLRYSRIAMKCGVARAERPV
jgi:hypothetical protein